MFELAKRNKFLFKGFIGLFVFMELFGILLFPAPVKAVIPVTVTESIPAKTEWGWAQVKTALTSAALGSLLHASSYFMRKMAYDSATYIASGGKGQGALAFKKGPAAYFEQLALDSSADMINEFGKPFGLNLCSTPDLQLQIFLQIGLHSLYWREDGAGAGPSPSCNWQQMSNAWSAEAFEEKYGPGGSKFIAENFTNALRFEDSDFGIALGAKAKIDRNNAEALIGAAQERTEGQGFKPLTSLISGEVKSPAQVVKEESKVISSKQQGDMTSSQLAGVYGSGFLQIIPMAASVFLNTLVGEGLKTAQKELLNLFKDKDGGGSAFEALTYESSGFQSSRKKAESVFSDLLTVAITQVNNYTQLEEFSACPDYPVKPGLNNCVMDSGLRQALEESKLDEPLTITKALEKGYLHGNWPLYSPDRTADNLDKNCYQKGYCYPNIQKLRRARILPLGFEIAATLADPDDPEALWTLQQVVDGFYDCGKVGDDFVEDQENHPYCHLIDPNWILKAPEARCNAQVYAANLLDDNNTGVRSQECVDPQSCLKENEDGSCEFFGYCTKEKNVWRFNADKCEPQYNTCTTFVSSEGDVSSYLARTLDYGECNFESVGCRAYSTEKTGDPAVTSTTWAVSSENTNYPFESAGRNQTVYFNQNIENYTDNCSADIAGCSEFYPAVGSLDDYENSYTDPIYLQKAPDYLGCYDTDLSVCPVGDDPITSCEFIKNQCWGTCVGIPPNYTCISQCNTDYDSCMAGQQNNGCAVDIDWPQTKADLLVLENRPEVCEDYAQVCLPSEATCDAYTPVAGPNPVEIPGIIGENYCDESCVNYETFRQAGTSFEPGEFPLYFIPDEATECSSDFVGCDEFTNIDELARGGEALEYYNYIKYCERPTDDNEKVFYSWEGSAQEGYVLKLHELRPINEVDYSYLETLEADLNLDELLIDVYPIGSPAYASDSVASLGGNDGGNYNACNQVNYNNLINNIAGDTALADCRALYDKDGKIYYRLLSNTISVSDQCHPLRKTNSNLYVDDNIEGSKLCAEKFGVWGDVPDDEPNEGVVCQRCYAGGRYENGSCIYWAMSGADESNACPSTANGCREYSGNAANNLQQVFLLDFEIFDEAGVDAINEAKSGWEPKNKLFISPESIQVTKESLKVTADKAYYEFDNTFAFRDTFELSFWARGESQNLEIYFEQEGQDEPDYFTFNKLTGDKTSVGIGTEWRQYLVGPVSLSDITSNTIKLVFDSKKIMGEPLYFIDNIQLSRVSDTYYRVKDSWKKAYDVDLGDDSIKDVPGVCDDTPNDPYPGLALGCRQYEEQSTGSTDIYATGFDTMCRENAIGCRAIYETNNNLQVNTVIYNLWCEDGERGGSDKKCELLFDPGVDEDEVVLGSCIVLTREDGCFVDGPINEDDNYYIPNVSAIGNSDIKVSTVIIPGDSDEPIFLTDRSDFRCTEKSKGCQEIALQEKVLPNALAEDINAYDFVETFVLNDPDNYESTLCRSDLVGCGEFAVNSERYFFKDPTVTGNSFCEYKDQVESDEVTYKGWFLKDFGKCEDSGDLCKIDDDCDEDILCLGQGTVPCYEDYLMAGGEYGMWSNKTENYTGLVGVCAESENGCREFIDPQDTSSLYPDGYAYYLIYNQKLINPVGECEGQASLQEGCVLFNKTDYPNLLYNSKATYYASEKKNFEPVSLVSESGVRGTIDTNILLKVVRDRQCAEWLACQGYVEVIDTQVEGAKRNVCYAVQSCEDGTALNCSGPVKDSIDKDKVLDIDLYINREISWQEGREYSGLSLYNQYQVGDLDYIRVKNTYSNSLEEDEVFVGFVDKQRNFECEGEGSIPCGLDYLGLCYNEKCIYPATGGTFLNTTNFQEDLYGQECRGYPEQDSPFVDNSGSIVENWQGMRPLYSNSSYVNSNVCQPGEDCSCDYLRIGFGENGLVSEDRFFELDGKIGSNYVNGDAEPQGLIKEIKVDNLKIIQGGDRDGEYCDGELDPCPTGVDTTTALGIVKKNRRIGWKGYCLERDYSHHIDGRIDSADEAFACLTWMPLDFVPGAFDIYNADEGIGYVPPTVDGVTGGKAYCTEMIGWQNMELMALDGWLYEPYKFDCNFLNKGLNSYWAKNNCKDYSFENWDGVEDLPYTEYKRFFTLDLDNGDDIFINTPPAGFGITAEVYKYDLKSFQEMTWSFINTIAGQNVEEEILHHDDWNVPVDEVASNVSNLQYKNLWNEFAEDNKNKMPFYLSEFNYYNPGSHFISRVDTGANPGDSKKTATINNGIWSSLTKDNSKLSEFSRWTISFMATQGYDGRMVAPLLPELENPGQKWMEEFPSPQNTYHESDKKNKPDQAEDELYDSGVLRHMPNKIESFITKDMIKGVSFVPLWVIEHGTGDNIEAVQIPMMGLPLAIDFNAEYQSVNGDFEKITEKDLGHSSQSNSDSFGKYWVLKSEYGGDHFYQKALEGYILIWTAVDPFSGVSEVSSGSGDPYTKYNIPNWDSRTQNPFKININEQYIGTDEREGNHVISLEVLFEKDTGKFAGYRSRNLSTFGGNSEWGYSTAVVFTFQPMCVEAVEVYDDAPDDGSFINNKAWTNRIWESSGYDELHIKETDNYIVRDIPALPFGSINSDFNDKWFTVLQDHELGDTPHAGRPTLCLNDVYFEGGQDNNIKISSYCRKAKDPIAYGGGYTLLQDHFYPGVYTPDEREMIAGTHDDYNNLTVSNIDLAKKTIQDLFAKVYNVHSKVKKLINPFSILLNGKFDDNISPTTSTDKYDNYSYKYKDIAFDEGKPPTIFYPAEEFKLAWNNYQDKFAINGVGSVDNKLYGKGNLNANVSFYAWANHNQMALRRIMVDWREDGMADSGTISGEAMGYYMNAKPYCDIDDNYECYLKGVSTSTPDVYSGLTCTPKPGNELNNKTCPSDYSCGLAPMTAAYGNQINETCRQEPINLVWNYTCDVTPKDIDNYGDVQGFQAGAVHGGLSTKPYVYRVSEIKNNKLGIGQEPSQKWYELLKSKGHKDNDLVCVFQPRVQVLDNWGWCTGTCEDGGEDGCYNEYGENKFQHCEGIDPYWDENEDKSWLEFDDIVVVAP